MQIFVKFAQIADGDNFCYIQYAVAQAQLFHLMM